MKQSRRQELKTNVLSVYLQQAYEKTRLYANYIIGGAAIVVVVIVAGMVMRHNRLAALDQAQRTYSELRGGNVAQKPELIDQAGRLADEQGPDSEIGAQARELQGDLAYQLAMGMTKKDQAEKIRRLKQAQTIYEQLLTTSANWPGVAARLRMSLAATEESLFVAGEGSAEDIRRQYQQVIDGQDESFKTLARAQLNSLDDRLAKLTIVATQPAASAPATTAALGPSSRPTTRPSSGPAVVGVTTLPAGPAVKTIAPPSSATAPAR
jgi:hypothetical protein